MLTFTFTFTITACNDSTGAGGTTDSKELTVADVFNNIECSLENGKLKKVSYDELSNSTTIDDSKSSMMKIKFFASRKFQVEKITLKFKGSWVNFKPIYDGYHATDKGYSCSLYKDIFKTEVKEDQNRTCTDNKEYDITLNLSEPFIVEKNKGFSLWLSSTSDNGSTYWTNIQIYGNVIEE